MLVSALPLAAGATKEFKERILSDEPGVTQAEVYFKKAGTEEKLSEAQLLKLSRGSADSAPSLKKSLGGKPPQ